MLRTSIDKIKQNGFELTKKRRYPANTITDADYADDIAILANTPNQAETLLHSLEQTAAGIGLHVNPNKNEYMRFNQTGDISTLDGTSLKLVDKFTYLGSSVSSTEKYIDTRLTKAWTAIDKLSIIWKSDLIDKMKRCFFHSAVVSKLLYGYITWTLTKRLEKKLDCNYTRMLWAILNKSWKFDYWSIVNIAATEVGLYHGHSWLAQNHFSSEKWGCSLLSICLLISGYIRHCSIGALCRRISLFSILWAVFHQDRQLSCFYFLLELRWVSLL